LGETAIGQLFGPIAHRRSADPQTTRDFSLRQFSSLQPPTAQQSALFYLFSGKVFGFPDHTRIVRQLLLQGIVVICTWDDTNTLPYVPQIVAMLSVAVQTLRNKLP
jgi:hypothetical protein